MSSDGANVITTNTSGNGEITPQQAIERMIQAIYVGQTRGAWKLEEVPELLKAIKVFTTPQGSPAKN